MGWQQELIDGVESRTKNPIPSSAPAAFPFLPPRFLAELSDLKAARIGAAEAAQLREQLAAAQGVSAAMVQARQVGMQCCFGSGSG